MKGIIFKTVKEGFRRLHKKHKAEVRRLKRDPNTAPPVIPMSLKKADFKRKIRGTKFTGAAEFKAKPGSRRRLIVGIEKGRREKKKFRKPIIYGKGFASDKPGKTLQIQPLTFQQRKLMKKEMEESAKRLYKKMFLSKKKKGGLQTIKMVKSKLEKASAAHAGQAKALGKVIAKKKFKKGGAPGTNGSSDLYHSKNFPKPLGEVVREIELKEEEKLFKFRKPKKKLLGGLLTSTIKAGAKKYFKTGNKTQQIVNKHGGTRSQAKADVKSGIKNEILTKLKDKSLSLKERRSIIRDINKFR